jgi:ATP-binding cassette subfamily F protein 3
VSLITLQNLSFDYGRQVILDGANLTLNPGERYGLVGVNGAGKSTLIRLLAGELQAHRGEVQRAARVSVGYLTQDTRLESDEPLLGAVRAAAFAALLETERRLEELSRRMGAGEQDEALLEEYGKLHERFEAADGYAMQARCETTLMGLGFDEGRFQQSVNTLSGGQKRRAALAAVMLASHDVLLLDEPTNHLDLEAREWLEEALNSRKGALIAISHDRAFLDNTTSYTLHLYNGRLDRFQGSYTKFMRQWKEQKSEWEARYRRQKEQIAKTEAFIRKNIAGQRTNQAKSRRKQLQRLQRIEAPPSEGRQYRFDLDPKRPSGQVVFEAKNLGHRFGELNLFSGFEFQILRGEKVGIIGPNGTGKTTLLRILSRELVPGHGSVTLGHNTDLGYYDQNLSLVNDTNTVLGELRALDPLASDGDLRSLLAAFGFTEDMIDQPVHSLSGGERARLSLLHLIFERHNTILLDEPTNHLDTDSREALEEALVHYPGTLICVSHDRYFLNRICDHIFAFETQTGGGIDAGRSQGGVRRYLGNYDDYRRKRRQEEEERAHERADSSPGGQVPARPSAGAPSPPQRAEERDNTPVQLQPGLSKRQLSKNQLGKIRREIQDLEEEISLLEAELELLSQRMSSGELDSADLAKAAQSAGRFEASLSAKMQRWEELNRLMERH